MTPARRCFAVQRIRDPLSVHTPADNPNGVLFAFSIASCGVLKEITERTGPKISSRAMRCACVTPVKNVGGYQNPFAGIVQAAENRSAPSVSPDIASSVILSSCSRELIAPISVFLSNGSPRRIWDMRRLSFSNSSSWMFSCTRRRDPAQQTCPWLKKMPLTMPSTVSSIGASSKTILAPLPPSSRVKPLPVPATERAISFPTSVDPVNAILLIPGWLTIAAPVAPSPVTIFTTPAGSSACWQT